MTKIVYVSDWNKLAQFAKKPPGFDFSEYDPIRATCNACNMPNMANRSLVETHHSYQCSSCGSVQEVLWVAPDPAFVATNRLMVIMEYLN